MPVLLILLAALTADAPAATRVDTLAICPSEFRQSLEPWVAHRQAQGHQVAVVSNLGTPDELRAEIQRRAKTGLRYVVLVGDADPAQRRDEKIRNRSVPTEHIRAVVNLRYGSEPLIASDNWYADVDGDRLPDVAIGRLTADSPAELTTMIRKIIAYEQSTDFGPWRRQVHFVAGLGGFGGLADTLLEAAAKTVITDGIPSQYTSTMTYASWQSPYCPDPRRFGQVTRDRLSEGSLFWVYMGHGEERSVDHIHTPAGSFPILNVNDVPRLSPQHAPTIACLLACYSGAFDQPADCLAEELLRAEGGPVAVLCGTRVTMPYGLSVLSTELLHECFDKRPAALGDAILAAKRATMSDTPREQRGPLDAMAKTLNPKGSDLAAERAEHLDLMVLLGDPLLQLPWPGEVKVKAPTLARPSETIRVSFDAPLSGTADVELVVRRDRLTFRPPYRKTLDAAAIASYEATYDKANDPVLVAKQLAVEPGTTTLTLTVPASAQGACHVRVFIAGKASCAAGAADLRIESPDDE